MQSKLTVTAHTMPGQLCTPLSLQSEKITLDNDTAFPLHTLTERGRCINFTETGITKKAFRYLQIPRSSLWRQLLQSEAQLLIHNPFLRTGHAIMPANEAGIMVIGAYGSTKTL
jgi:hypothetical protein